MPGAGAGAIASVCAVTVAVDCHYGPCKSNLPVIIISKNKSTEDCISSHPFPISNYCACPQCVGDGSCGPLVFGGTWWWKGGRKREAGHMTN